MARIPRFYPLIIGVFGLLIWFIISKGEQLQHDIMISHASIVAPFFLGVGLAYFIFQQHAPANVNFLSFALFMGIAVSITAFPVLAGIVQERNSPAPRRASLS